MKNLIKKSHTKKAPFGGWGLLGGLLLLFLFTATLANAQMVGTPYPTPKGCTNVATEGQEFWVSFGNNYNIPATQLYLALKVTNGNSAAATVTLTFTATGQSATYSVPGNTTQLIDLSAVNPAGGTVSPDSGTTAAANLGDMRASVYLVNLTANTSANSSNTLHITSNTVVSLVAFNTYSTSTDATILLPPSIWGQEYYNLSYYSNISNSFEMNIIIANQDNTHITITNYAGTVQATATLSAGQAFYNVGDNGVDFTGQRITTDKPVAFFVHNSATYIPNSNVEAADILFQQLMPTAQYRQYFLLPNETQFNTVSSIGSTANNLVRVIAEQDGTVVSFTNATGNTSNATVANGFVAATNPAGVTLNKGQWTQVQIGGGQDGYCTISATHPVGVVQLMEGGQNGENNPNYTIGDPAICRISSVTALIPTAAIAPFVPPANSTFSNLGKVTNGGSTSTNNPVTPRHYALITAPTADKDFIYISRNGAAEQKLTDAANAPSQNVTDATNTAAAPNNIISAATQWVDVTTPINGVLYSYIRYDFNYQNDRTASFRITDRNFINGGGMLITQVGIGQAESYTFNSGSGGCLAP